ncbi:MAG: hypothetical protein P8169_03400 [Chloroflexota bacterium]
MRDLRQALDGTLQLAWSRGDGKAHVPFSAAAKSDARRGGDARFFQQRIGQFQAVLLAVREAGKR